MFTLNDLPSSILKICIFLWVSVTQKIFKYQEVKTSPTPQQRVKQTNLRIFVGFYERSNKRKLFNVTLGHVIELDTHCGDISSYEVPLWTFWCGISPSSLVYTQQEFYVWLFGTNWCGCQPADICRRLQRCIAPPILVRDILCPQWNKNDSLWKSDLKINSWHLFRNYGCQKVMGWYIKIAERIIKENQVFTEYYVILLKGNKDIPCL